MKKLHKRVLAVAGIAALLATLVACEEEHVHDYSEIGNNTKNHWHYCPEDNEKDSESVEAHYDENADGKCDVCGYEVGLPHEHDYSAWGADEENHWKYCLEDNTKDESSIAAHADEDEDGKCDACGQDMNAPTEESVSIELVDGVPTLIVKGPITETVGCLKLHADGNGEHLYWNNVSKFSGAYEFRVALNELTLEKTPWWRFHIYAYAESSPSAQTEPARKIDLERGALIEIGQYFDYAGVRYSVIGENSVGTQLVIQPTVAPKTTVESIAVDVTEKPTLVVKGTYAADVGCIVLHADANGVHYYGQNVSEETGKFELRFDLTQISVEGTPWAWFHIYTYDVADPADFGNNYTKSDLIRGDHLADGAAWEYEGVRYEIRSDSDGKGNTYGLVVIQPKPIAAENT